jgi:hypothetical protein
VDACWRGATVSFIGIGFLTFQSMVASNRIVRFLGMPASIANICCHTNFKAALVLRNALLVR